MFFVYALFNSDDWSTVKYIGAASWLGRPLCHEKESTRAKNRRHRSIQKLLRSGHHVGWKLLEACDSWKETLAAERRLIQEHKVKFGGKRPDWNFTDGGEGVVGLVHTAETRKRMSLARIGHIQTPEIRAKIGMSNRGQTRSAEQRANIGKASRGREVSTETRAKLSVAQTGKKRSAATRAKMRLTNRHEYSPRVRARIGNAVGNANRQRVWTPESRAKLSASLKNRKFSPEHCAKLSVANRRRWAKGQL